MGHDHDHDHPHGEPRWKDDSVRVIKGDQLDPNTVPRAGTAVGVHRQ